MAASTNVMSVAESEEALCAWQRRVDEICDQFEDSWEESGRPSIEDYLVSCRLPPTRQAALLCELLKLDRELRRGRGESPSASDYLARFPEHANVVHAVFGDNRLGTYEIIGLIGEGGMGSVYRAYDSAMRRTVALKVIRSNRLDDSSAQTRFRLEAQLAARLDHEHIVPVYDAGQEGTQLFYTMRYIQGRNLDELIGGRPLDSRRVARYIEQVALAVDHAHDQGVLHRDIKPSNVLIDAADRAFVTDFGLAKTLDQATGATRSTDRLGTLGYMSPEQARNPARAVIESDVYSLGATLYEAVTGKPPFHGESVLATLDMIEHQEPIPPRKINTRVPRDVETICLKCLNKEPRRRYVSARELADDLARFRKGEPIKARRVGWFERVRLWARRNPTAAALAAVTGLLLAAVLGVVQLRSALESSDRRYQRSLAKMELIALAAERQFGIRPVESEELLQIVLSDYDDFLATWGNDSRFSRELAVVLTRVARIKNLLGARREALIRHEQALELRQALALASPNNLELKAELAETWHDIGILRGALGDFDGAIKAYRQALDLRLALVDREPSNFAFRNDLARSYGYIGDWQRDQGDLDGARASYDKALRIREELWWSRPSDLASKFQLARSYNNNGNLEREVAGQVGPRERDIRQQLALVWQRKAILRQKELVNQDPVDAQHQLDTDTKTLIRVADFRSDLAGSYSAAGMVLEEMGRDREAKAAHAEALKLLDALVKDYPGASQYKGTLARNKSARAGIALRTPGEEEIGRKLLDEAFQEQTDLAGEHPDRRDYRLDLEKTEKLRGR